MRNKNFIAASALLFILASLPLSAQAADQDAQGRAMPIPSESLQPFAVTGSSRSILNQALASDGRGELQAEIPATDSRPVWQDSEVQESSASDVRETTMLNGSVEKHGASADAEKKDDLPQSQSSGISASDTTFQEQKAQSDSVPPYSLALKKLSTGVKLNSDDYRSLGIGILGYESDRTYFQNEGKIVAIFKDCPAMEAGLRLGDRVIEENAQKEDKQVDTTRPSWMFKCGIAGEPVDVTVNRKRETLNVHLVRMNIEDIPDEKIRRQYEHWVDKYGTTGEIHQAKASISAGSIIRALIGI